MEKTQICIIGLGYIGLPTAALLTSKGFQVTGVDINQDIVKELNKGKVHISEPELDEIIQEATANSSFKATTSPPESDIFIIAVPTPIKNNFKPELKYVDSAIDSILPVLKPNNLVLLESTIPVGTTDKAFDKIIKNAKYLLQSDQKIFMAHCPERVLPGQIMKELVENDRIVGGVDQESTHQAVQFYQKFVKGQVIETTAKTAELCKLCENSYRDLNIAFANELSMICDSTDINVWELIKLANRHPRVNILSPGPGVGGHCIAVDPWFIVDSFPEHTPLIQTARQVNSSKPHFILEKVRKIKNLKPKTTVGFLGLSYKANVGDLRESPAVEILQNFCDEFPDDCYVCEPFCNQLPTELNSYPQLHLTDRQNVIQNSDLIVLLTDHSDFLEPALRIDKSKILIDTRGVTQGQIKSNNS